MITEGKSIFIFEVFFVFCILIFLVLVDFFSRRFDKNPLFLFIYFSLKNHLKIGSFSFFCEDFGYGCLFPNQLSKVEMILEATSLLFVIVIGVVLKNHFQKLLTNPRFDCAKCRSPADLRAAVMKNFKSQQPFFHFFHQNITEEFLCQSLLISFRRYMKSVPIPDFAHWLLELQKTLHKHHFLQPCHFFTMSISSDSNEMILGVELHQKNTLSVFCCYIPIKT